MNFFHRNYGSLLKASLLTVFLCVEASTAQDFSAMGISDVVSAADILLQRGDYSSAIPALKEVIVRTAPLTDAQGRETAQTCRFQLARAQYQVGHVADGMKVLDEYLQNEPRQKERLALRMMAQGYFDTQEWTKIEAIAERLLGLSNLEKEDLYNANLLLGQARFRLEKWEESVEPLGYAAKNAKDERISSLCQVMIVRSLVEAESWRELFGWIPRIYRTDSKYDISLNLTLMKAGKARFEDSDYLNALLLYRMVLPRETLLDFSSKRVRTLSAKLVKDKKVGITASVIEERQNEIDDINELIKTLTGLPPYEEEVAFRIGQIYAEVSRYWEGFVLFDKLYRDDQNGEIGEASMLQSVLILYDIEEFDRAEERVLKYLAENPKGKYARTQLSMIVRDNLIKQNFDKVIGLRSAIEGMPDTIVEEDRALQSDIYYMLAFAYFQIKDYKSAGEQFTVITDSYSESSHAADSQYFRGMTFMMQADYASAIIDFKEYQLASEFGDNLSAALFREAVCQFGLGKIQEAEVAFTRFIETFPEDILVSEAYSMRGDIEAAKEASSEDPYTLDRALGDYRKGIDKAANSAQASYAAFQAAKVYKLEYKWQEIIDLMNYYMDRWEEDANVAESVFWIGQSQIELDQVDAAVTAYMEAIERFGNDPHQDGVDKIIFELVKVSNYHLSEEDREGLAVQVKLKLTTIDDRLDVLRLRLLVAQALLQGDDIAAALGAELLTTEVNLELTTPASLALMCDAAVEMGNVEEMERLYVYFLENYEESDLLWHAYRANTYKLLADEDYWKVLGTIDEAQSLFGADSFMAWAQLKKADTQYKLEKFKEAEKEYNMILNVPEWRGPAFAEAMFGMGKCRFELDDLETAHSFFQRTYLLFKSYSDGDWAAQGYMAAANVLLKLGREEDAVNTWKAMLEDVYTNRHPLAEPARENLKKYGNQ